MVTAADVAQSLDVPHEEADALLTELAKTIPDQVSLEVDDAGGIYYRFPSMLTRWPGEAPRVRVDGPSPTNAAAPPAEAEVLDAEVIPPPQQQRR
jgi:hypothetical protein